jgi:4-hydroxybutyrate CoA-transferase
MKLCPDFKSALQHIPHHSSIFVHGGAATPLEMLRVLGQDFADLQDIEMIHLHTEGECQYASPKHASFRITNLFTGQNLRKKIDYDRID